MTDPVTVKLRASNPVEIKRQTGPYRVATGGFGLRGAAGATGATGASPASDAISASEALRQSFVDINFVTHTETIRDEVTPGNANVAALGTVGTFARAAAAETFGPSRLLEDVSSGDPRYWFDPETGENRGVMFEPANAGTINMAQDITTWSKTNVTVTGSAATGIDGTTSAYSVLETTTNGSHLLSQAKSLTSGTKYAFAFAIKPNGRDMVRVYAKAAAGVIHYADITIPARGIAASSEMDVTFKDLPNGWVWVSASFTADVTASFTIGIFARDERSVTYAGDTAKGFYIDRAQFGTGDFPQWPYAGSAAVQDQYNIAATNYATSATAGTIVIDCDAPPDDGTNYLCLLYAAGTNQAILRTGSAGNGQLVATLNQGANTKSIITRTGFIQTQTRMRVALIWDATDMQLWVNGVCHGIAEHNGAPSSLTDWRIGWSGSTSWGSTIQRARYYPHALDASEIFSWRDHPIEEAVSVSGSSPDRIVTLETAHGPLPLTAGGDDHGPWIDVDAGKIRWAHRNPNSGAVTPMALPLSIRHRLDAATQARWEFIVDGGQSRQSGINALPLADTSVVSANRAMMPKTGTKIGGGIPGNDDVLKTPEQLVPLRSLQETVFGAAGQTIAAQFVAQRLSDLGSSVAMFYANTAIGSTPISVHLPGEEPYTNGGNALGVFNLVSHLCGIRPEGGFRIWNQGDGDSGAYDATQAGYLSDLETMFDADLAVWTMVQDWAESRFGTRPRDWWMLLCQFNKGTDMDVADAMLEASQDGSRKIRMACVDYIFKTSYMRYLEDPTTGINDSADDHFGPKDQLLKGHYFARMADHITDGDTTANILHPTLVERSGTTVTVTFNTSAPNLVMPLQFNTSLVPNHSDGNFGISYWDGGKKGVGTKISISGTPAFNGSNQLVFNLASTPTGPVEYLGLGVDPESPADKIGAQAGAPRCNIRDSETETVTIDGDTLDTHNYCALGYFAKS